MDYGKFTIGLVSSSDAATYVTQVQVFDGDLKSPMQGIPLAGVFSSVLGFKECTQYPIGVRVLCYVYSYDKCYILGMIPDSDMGNLHFSARTALDSADGNFDEQNSLGYKEFSTKNTTFNQNRPTDVVEGEHVLTNEFGILLGLFQSLAVLKASELSQIQCFLLDDLVRIISHNYEHLHAMGEFKIFHDGKSLMVESGFTHDPREALGTPQVTGTNQKVFVKGGPPSEKGTDESDFYDFSNNYDKIKAIERLKIFLGKTSDLLHCFITRPDPDAIRVLDGYVRGKYDTGLADLHVGLDGRINVRTVTGASIEKTNWIKVPHRVRTPEDPKGDAADDISFKEKDPFNFDNSVTYRGNPTLYFLQMRDCNTYLQELYNYKHFQQYVKDFKFSEGPGDNETKIQDIQDIDSTTKVKFSDYKLRRSGLYLMDNGGVMIKDAWGSALVFEGGDIYIQAAKDIVNQPLRNYITKAGQFISMVARKDIDLSSTEEGLRVKTEKVQHFYSDKQGIVLQSNSDNDTSPTPEDEAYTGFGGILLKSKKGIYSYGNKIFDRAEERSLIKAPNIYFQQSGDGRMLLQAEKQLTLESQEAIQVTTEKSLNLVSKGSALLVAGGSLAVAGVETAFGNAGSVIGMVPHPGSLPAVMDGVVPAEAMVAAFTISNTDLQEQFAPFDSDDKFTNTKFRFLASEKYQLKSADCIPMTVAQQDDVTFDFLNLVVWEEYEVNDTLPFPGKDKFDEYYITCEMKNLQSLNNDVFSKDSAGLTNTKSELTKTSLQEYKTL